MALPSPIDRDGPPEALRVEEVERPVPKDDEVLIRVRVATDRPPAG
jgi:NADPH:quinone reductase-like Zn-dependent oxidoreductase